MGGEVSEWYRKGRKGTCMKYKQTKQREKKKWVKNKGSEENKTWKVEIEMEQKKIEIRRKEQG